MDVQPTLRIYLPGTDLPGTDAGADGGAHADTVVGRQRRSVVRRRLRHGRGRRGELIPMHLPGSRSRSERFDGWVAESAQRLEQLWSTRVADIAFLIQDIPDGLEDLAANRAPIPLASATPAASGRPAVVTAYRCPIQMAARGILPVADLLHDAIVEQVAELMGLPPERVDPEYGRFEQ